MSDHPWKAFFAAYGEHSIVARGDYLSERFTIDELYAMFRDRLVHDLVAARTIHRTPGGDRAIEAIPLSVVNNLSKTGVTK